MFGMRARAASFYRRLSGEKTSPDGERDLLVADAILVARAIHARAVAGEATTLRQLHKITHLTQPEALRAVAELERADLLSIEHDVNDALESKVLLDEAMKASISQIARRDAA